MRFHHILDNPPGPATPPRAGGARATLWAALLLGSLLAYAFDCVKRTQRHRRTAKSRPLPEPVQTWEAEGGRCDPVSDEKTAALIAGI